MANREIKTTLKLEGEQQFRKAMKGASDAIKVLNSEQKLAAAQFEATGNKEQFLADKADILRRKIEEQQKAVKAAQEAVQKLKDKGVEPTNKSMQEWTRKLNDSQAYLVRLQGDLNNTETELQQQGQAFEEAGNAADNYGQQLENIGTGFSLDNMISSLDALEQKLTGALNAVGRLAQGIFDAEVKSSQWADDLLTQALMYNMDTETLQAWRYAAQFIDTDVETIISAQDKLMKNMTSESEDTQLMFNRFGVVTRNTDQSLRDVNETFWDTIDALGKMEDAHGKALTTAERDAAAQALFGKSYRELIPLINATSKGWEEAVQKGRNVAVVDDELVQKQGEFNDAYNDLVARWEKLKNEVLAGLSEPLTQFAEATSEAVTKFNQFLESAEGQEALSQLSAALSELVETVTNVGFSFAFAMATTAIDMLVEVLKWINDHGLAVSIALGSIATAVALIKVATPVLEVLKLLKSINWLNMQKGAKALGDAMSSGAPEKAAEVAGETVTKGGGLLGAAVAKVGGWLSNLAGWAAAPLAALTAAGVMYEAVDRAATHQYDEAKRITEEGVAEVEAAADDAAKRFGEIRQKLAEALVDDATYSTPDGETNPLLKLFEEYGAELEKSLPGLDVWQTIKANAENALTAEGGIDWAKLFDPDNVDNLNSGKWLDIATQLLNELTAAMEQTGADADQGMANGVNENTGVVSEAFGGMAQEGVDAAADVLQTHSPSVVMYDMGLNVAQGLADGINDRAAAAIAAAESLAAQVEAVMRRVLAIHSPSGVMEELGGYVGEGFARGIEGQIGEIERMASAMGRTVSSVWSPTVRMGGAAGAAGDAAQMVNLTIEMDRHAVGRLVAPVVDAEFGSRLRAGR